MSCRLIESGFHIMDDWKFGLHLFRVPEFVEYWDITRYKFVDLIIELRNSSDDYLKDTTDQYLEDFYLRGVYLMSLTGYLNVKGHYPFFSNRRNIIDSLARSDDAKKGIPELLKDIMVQELEKEWDMFREDMLRIIREETEWMKK